MRCRRQVVIVCSESCRQRALHDGSRRQRGLHGCQNKSAVATKQYDLANVRVRESYLNDSASC